MFKATVPEEGPLYHSLGVEMWVTQCSISAQISPCRLLRRQAERRGIMEIQGETQHLCLACSLYLVLFQNLGNGTRHREKRHRPRTTGIIVKIYYKWGAPHIYSCFTLKFKIHILQISYVHIRSIKSYLNKSTVVLFYPFFSPRLPQVNPSLKITNRKFQK